MKNISVLDIQPDDQFLNHDSWILWTATTPAISMPDNIDMVSCEAAYNNGLGDVKTDIIEFHKNRRLDVIRG